jgi:transcription elongation factor
MQLNSSRPTYQANDLINYNNNKNCGLVLQVHEDYLKIINEQNNVVNVKIADIGKKIVAPRPGMSV